MLRAPSKFTSWNTDWRFCVHAPVRQVERARECSYRNIFVKFVKGAKTTVAPGECGTGAVPRATVNVVPDTDGHPQHFGIDPNAKRPGRGKPVLRERPRAMSPCH